MGLFDTKDKIESEAEFDRLFEELGLEIDESEEKDKKTEVEKQVSGFSCTKE